MVKSKDALVKSQDGMVMPPSLKMVWPSLKMDGHATKSEDGMVIHFQLQHICAWGSCGILSFTSDIQSAPSVTHDNQVWAFIPD